MPPKRFCPKCEQRHEKPTGRKCMRMATAADIETGAFYANRHGCTSVRTMTTTLTYSSSHLEPSLAVTSFSSPLTTSHFTHTAPLSAPSQHPSTLQPTPRGVRFSPPCLPAPFSSELPTGVRSAPAHSGGPPRLQGPHLGVHLGPESSGAMAASPLLRGAPTPHRTPLAPPSGIRSVPEPVSPSRTPQWPLVSRLLPLPSPQIPYTAAHLLPQHQTRSATGAPPPPRQQPSHPPTDPIADSLDTLTALVSSFGQRLSASELQSTRHAASLSMSVPPSHVPYPHDPALYTAAPLPAQPSIALAAAPPGTCGPTPHHGPPSAEHPAPDRHWGATAALSSRHRQQQRFWGYETQDM